MVKWQTWRTLPLVKLNNKKIKKKGEGKTFFEPFFFPASTFFGRGAIVRICILGLSMWLHLSRVATRG